MTRLDPAPDRRREQIIGAVVVLVGVAVLVLSVIALIAAGDDPSSDVAGPSVTLPRDSASASPSGTPSATGSPTTTSPGATGSGSASATTSTSASTSSAAGGAIGSQPLVVLNNTRQVGLAQQAAATFTQGGWKVSDTGNLDQDILSTCAYYDPSVPGAQAAAEALMQQFPAIKRTKEKFGALPAGPVVVVLTADYTAQ
ncbi:LytR C-terminal domain-containing protein [Jatrophihabitans sp. YIM 134969]